MPQEKLQRQVDAMAARKLRHTPEAGRKLQAKVQAADTGSPLPNSRRSAGVDKGSSPFARSKDGEPFSFSHMPNIELKSEASTYTIYLGGSSSARSSDGEPSPSHVSYGVILESARPWKRRIQQSKAQSCGNTRAKA